MKIGKYISELLFENDFVILPEIGEFSTKYIPAKFVPELRKVESPSKVIAFNDKNKSGGGLLIEYIASKEKISNEEAKQFIDNFVAEMQNSLKSGKKVELERIGVFSLDQGGTLIFEPDTSINYLDDSVGMSSVQEPVKKTEEESKSELDKVMEEAKTDIPERPVEVKPEEKKDKKIEATPKLEEPVKPQKASGDIPKREPVTPTTYKKSSASKAKFGSKDPKSGSLPPALKWVAFTVLPLLIIIIILAFNYDYIFGDKSVIWQKDAPEPVTDYTLLDTEPADDDVISPEYEPEPVQEAFDPTVAPPTPEAGRPVYYIIVGSFEEEHSALILAEEIRGKGSRTASVFPRNNQGFYRVSYGYFYDLREAEQELAQAQNINQDAWILHR